MDVRPAGYGSNIVNIETKRNEVKQSLELTPASAVRHPSFQSVTRQNMLDCVGLVQYRTSSRIVRSFHFSSGLTRCRTVRHSRIYVYVYTHINILTYVLFVHMDTHKDTVCSMNMSMENVAWTRAWSMNKAQCMDMNMQHEHGHAA
jgi:hypothetical protein